MFTGIIEEVGRVASIQTRGEERRLTVFSSRLVGELKPGASVSVSGVCLTALDISKNSFSADLAQETWLRTSFSRLEPGALVNLELPLRASGRFDGHIVQGHVDGAGTVVSFEAIPGGRDYRFIIQIPSELTRYVVPKGSLSIEGISLTVAAMEETRAEFAIIPHTAEETNLRSLHPGDPVNLEVDVIAKYVEKWLAPARAASPLTVEKLVQAGF